MFGIVVFRGAEKHSGAVSPTTHSCHRPLFTGPRRAGKTLIMSSLSWRGVRARISEITTRNYSVLWAAALWWAQPVPRKAAEELINLDLHLEFLCYVYSWTLLVAGVH